MRGTTSLLPGLVLVLLAAAPATEIHGQLNEELSLFADLIGGEWEGAFEGVDEPMGLGMSWEPILDGAAVQWNGWSSGMSRRNIYYWDREKETVAFLALTSNGYVGTGTAEREGSVLTFLGTQLGPDGVRRDTMARWEFLSDGTIRVLGYSHEGGEWVPGHTIIYARVGSG